MLLYHFYLIIYLIGAKAQYYPLTPPRKEEFNGDRPPYNIYQLPIRKIEDYWKAINELESAKNDKARKAIGKNTGVAGLPICAASPAFSHPFFFPLDPFHLFYENCMPHIWEIWVSDSKDTEVVHMRPDIASNLGAEIEKAKQTLPSSFCGPIRDPHKKSDSQYKIYEWMALLHWYIVPIAWELGFNEDVIKNFAIFSNAIEYAMTPVPRTKQDLINLRNKIILFLEGFESLYVGNDPLKVLCCRLSLFQLLFIPHHISYFGSIRFGSQATCERTIGEIGHGIRSKKSPFKNIVSYKTDKQTLKMLNLQYPMLFTKPELKPQKTSLFREFPIIQRQKNDASIAAQLQKVHSYIGVKSDTELEIQCYGKCPLPNNLILTSEIFEMSKKNNTCSSIYFEAHLGQAGDQDIDETEIEVEKTKPVFGKALAFYKVEVKEKELSLVVYHPLIERKKLYGKWYGKWSSVMYVLDISDIVSLVGIWAYLNDHVHILRKHPALSLLTLDECGVNSMGDVDNVE